MGGRFGRRRASDRRTRRLHPLLRGRDGVSLLIAGLRPSRGSAPYKAHIAGHTSYFLIVSFSHHRGPFDNFRLATEGEREEFWTV